MLEPMTLIAHATSKMNLSRILFHSAMLMRVQSADVEKAAIGPEQPPDAVLDQHRALVLGGVFMVVASLEASLNELVAEVEDKSTRLVGALLSNPDGVAALQAAWPKLERKSLVVKHQRLLGMFGASALEEHSATVKDIACLVSLRNALVHFRPEWLNKRVEHKRLEEELDGLFELNPLLPSGSIWFPNRCLSSDCLRWACDSVKHFSKTVCERLSIAERLVAFPRSSTNEEEDGVPPPIGSSA